jgi:hypothetical protein
MNYHRIVYAEGNRIELKPQEVNRISSIPLPSSEDFFAAQWSNPPVRPYLAEKANECGLCVSDTDAYTDSRRTCLFLESVRRASLTYSAQPLSDITLFGIPEQVLLYPAQNLVGGRTR